MTYVISDVHGRRDILDRMLDLIGFNSGDILYIIGDAADRGPDGVEILRWAMSESRVRFIKGNHEQMLLNAYTYPDCERYTELWLDNGGSPTKQAFDKLSDQDRAAMLDWIRKLPDHLDADAGTGRFRLVHAGWGFDTATRLWIRPSSFMPARGNDDRRIVVGHTPVMQFYPDPGRYLHICGAHMKIYHGAGFIGIDCGCGLPDIYKKRALACLRLDDMAEFYVPLD